MSKTTYFSDYENMEVSRTRLENSENQPIIKECLAKYGYDTEKINKGWEVLNIAESTYGSKKEEDNESSETFKLFSNSRDSIAKQYTIDRKLGKVLFEKTPEILKHLAINGSLSKVYIKWFETVNTFYTVSQNDDTIKVSFATLNVSAEHLKQQKTKIDKLKHLRTDYLREKGESQDATAKKDKAFADLDDWMREFKTVAKIALADHPQLLEALNIKA